MAFTRILMFYKKIETLIKFYHTFFNYIQLLGSAYSFHTDLFCCAVSVKYEEETITY